MDGGLGWHPVRQKKRDGKNMVIYLWSSEASSMIQKDIELRRLRKEGKKQ